MIDHTVQCNTMMKIEDAILDERRWPAGAVTVIIRFERGAATQNDKWPGSLVWTAGAGRRLGLPSAPHLALPCMTGSREGWLNRAPRWHSRTCTASSSDAVLSRSACPSVCLSVCLLASPCCARCRPYNTIPLLHLHMHALRLPPCFKCVLLPVVRAYYYYQHQEQQRLLWGSSAVRAVDCSLLYTCTLGGDFGYDFYTKESLDMMPSSVALHVGMISPFETESRVNMGRESPDAQLASIIPFPRRWSLEVVATPWL